MARNTVSLRKLEQLLSQGKTVTECAKQMGFSASAISRAKQRLDAAVTRDVAMRAAPEIVDQKLDASQQLSKANVVANELLDALMDWHRGNESALKHLAADNGIRSTDPRQLICRVLAEIRDQIRLQLDIATRLYNVEEVAKFQEIVMEEIGNASPEIRDRILKRLVERRAVLSSLRFD